MIIQVITNEKRNIPNGFDVNTLNSPMSFDDYSLNVIDLTSESLWKCADDRLDSIDSIDDFDSIHSIVCNSNSTVVLYVFPHNSSIVWDYSKASGKYFKKDELKNKIDFLITLVMSHIIPYDNCSWFDVTYERNKTVLGEMTYESDFYFSSPYVFDKESILTQSTSKKKTTIRLNERIVLTTCDIFQSQDALTNYIDNLFVPSTSNAIPEWVREFEFNDDGILKTQLDSEKNKIREAENTIESINKKIEINNEYKSILYASGNQLVKGVSSILERMLEIDLSEFKDVYKEDFVFQKNGITFVGEIKGVNSNVKYENISQAVRHVSIYADEHSETDIDLIKPILIINPFRKESVNDREPINEDQIRYSQKNKCLIVETVVLLRMFEKYLKCELSTDECWELITNETGLLMLQ